MSLCIYVPLIGVPKSETRSFFGYLMSVPEGSDDINTCKFDSITGNLLKSKKGCQVLKHIWLANENDNPKNTIWFNAVNSIMTFVLNRMRFYITN